MTRSRRRAAASLAVVAAVLAAPLILWAAGVDLPGTQPSDGSGDPLFPAFMDGTGPGVLRRPGLCDNCHAGYRSFGQAMYEPWDTWAGSMMAQSARDPLFWAALDIANQDDAALGDAGVGDFCLRCHVPKAWYEGRSKCTTAWGEEFDGSCIQGPMDSPDTDFEGMICHYCHRMYDASDPPPGQFADPAAPYAGNARVYLSTENDTMIGPFTDADSPSHPARGLAFHLSPAFCGQCHDVTNPVRNRRDVITGADLGYRMPIERTYSEYRQSRIADPTAPEHETCQTCHMPQPDHDGDGAPDDGYACSQEPGLRGNGTALEGPLRKHEFSGANSWMLAVLKGEYGLALDRMAQFDNGIAASLRMLTQGAVALDLTAPPTVVAGGSLAVNARITNLAGHKFPTGYPEGRRAWIHVAAGEDVDGDGALSAPEVQFESGAYDAATGVLVADAQERIYEAKLGVWDFNGTGQCDLVDAGGQPMFHFVLNDCVVLDNRIPPLGFAPDVETAPAGYTYPSNPALPGTLANWDDSAYAIPVPDTTTRPYVVEVRLRYQSTSKEYVEFLRDANVSTCDPFDPSCDPTLPDARRNRGEKMHDLWTAYDRAPPVDMATARAIVDVLPPPPGACCVLGSCMQLTAPECSRREGDFQGAGTTCAGSGCPPPGLPPGEASNVFAGAVPLLVTDHDPATGQLTLGFDPACDATDHAVIVGALTGVRSYAYSLISCGAGTSGSVAIDPGPGSRFFVVVGRTGMAEGSYGRDSLGAERPQRIGSDPCDLPQDLSATCR